MAQFDSDRDTVINNAFRFGVEKILLCGIDYQNNIENIKLCASNPKMLYCAIGIHPNTILEQNLVDELACLHSLIKNDSVKAIGEIGLDYFRNTVSAIEQQVRLRAQLELAQDQNLPVILHQRQSCEDLIKILCEIPLLKNISKRIRGVFHAFSGDRCLLDFVLKNDFYLGIGGSITYNAANQWLEIFNKIPISKILLETDSPFLPPQGLRGTRNIPQNVLVVAAKLSEIYSMPTQEVIDITWDNAQRLFNWDN